MASRSCLVQHSCGPVVRSSCFRRERPTLQGVWSQGAQRHARATRRPMAPKAAVMTEEAVASTYLEGMSMTSALFRKGQLLVPSQQQQQQRHARPTGLHCIAQGCAQERGPMKPEMQDRHFLLPDIAHHAAWPAAQPLAGQPSVLAGVLDGHAGSSTACRAAARLVSALSGDSHLWGTLASHLEQGAGLAEELVEGVRAALQHLVQRVDAEILAEDRSKRPDDMDGCTALMGLQVDRHLFVANVGDSRAIMSRAGAALRLTEDHKPGVDKEMLRIQANGGCMRMRGGSWRIMLPRGQGLATKVCGVSRALGDVDFKEPRQLLSAEPDVTHMLLQPGVDQFVVYASDGVWCALSDQEAVDIVAAALKQARGQGLSASDGARAAAFALLEESRDRGSTDDITVLVTPLEWS